MSNKDAWEILASLEEIARADESSKRKKADRAKKDMEAAAEELEELLALYTNYGVAQ